MELLPQASMLKESLPMQELAKLEHSPVDIVMSTAPSISSPTLPLNATPPAQNTTWDPEGSVQTSNPHWVFLVLLLVIVFSIAGNVLVCLAIITERKLHSATNYFLLSMAVADLMVALLVMPMALIKYIFGMWILGPAMCNIWVSLDVLCCTSSILHICTISLDRYLAICNPFSTQRRSRFQTPSKIVVVWMISGLLCSPIFVLGFLSSAQVLDMEVCTLTNRLFMIYGSIVAFYIPLVIVVVTYSRTAHALNKKAQAFATPKAQRLSKHSSENVNQKSKSTLRKAISWLYQAVDTNENSLNEYSSFNSSGKLPEEESVPVTDPIKRLKAETLTLNSSPRILRPASHVGRALDRTVIEMRRSTSGTLCKGRRSKINTERRASKVLGLVFTAFVIGWTPFFLANFLYALCPSCQINLTVFSVFEWLGWSSSMVNPFIYTIFNKTFQKTFWKLLTCQQSHRRRMRHTSRKRQTIIVDIKPPSPKVESV